MKVINYRIQTLSSSFFEYPSTTLAYGGHNTFRTVTYSHDRQVVSVTTGGDNREIPHQPDIDDSGLLRFTEDDAADL
jgi:hypothetical protein